MPHDSLTTLEFDKVRQLLAERTSFSVGRERALALLPSSDPDEVMLLQQLTQEAGQLRQLRTSLGLGGARDVTALARRAVLGALLTPSELLEVQATCRVSAEWLAALSKLERQLPALAELRLGLAPHRGLDEAIGQAIDDSAQVMDTASPTLHQLRTETRVAQDRLLTRLQALVHSPAARLQLQEPIVTQRSGRYVVPVKAELRSQFKGIVHDQSASGATLFMEPLAMVELGNRIRQLQLDEEREVERILRSLAQQVAWEADDLTRSVQTLGELDLLLAKSRLADAMRATRPEILHRDDPSLAPSPHRPIAPSSTSPLPPVLRLLDARHPLLSGEVVPLTLELGADYDVVVITGPNTGGKTVALKTVGLLALMAQAGLQIPAAAGSSLAVFEAVMADIGDEQSIEQSLSTFSSHVTNIVGMLREAGPRSLVLLDELGAGTDPLEGSALARAIVEFLLARRAYCVATTHYPELKAFAAATPRVENASVEFDLETLSPTYRLQVGLPGQSNALEIAARLGMPADVVESARQFLHPVHGELEGLLAEIRRERDLAEAERARVAALAEEQDRLRRRLRDALAEADRQRREAWQRAHDESEEMLRELRREAQRLRRELAAARPDRRQLESVIQQVEQLAAVPAAPSQPPAETPSEPDLPELLEPLASLAVGSEIVLPDLGVTGTILSLDGDEAELEVWGRRVRMPRSRLAEATAPSRAQRRAEAAAHERITVPIRSTGAGHSDERYVPLQLDLRGKRRDEAAQELDSYLHDAYMAGLRSVRVVHGRGTGAVRQAVQDVLAHSSLVADFSFADPREGGDGATVVRLTDQ